MFIINNELTDEHHARPTHHTSQNLASTTSIDMEQEAKREVENNILIVFGSIEIATIYLQSNTMQDRKLTVCLVPTGVIQLF